MAQNDRTTGLVGNAGIKVPVLAATTVAITLSGEQTVDGVALITGDRCLVKNQASGADNGIYVVDTGAWSRAKDFDGAYDIVRGTMVLIIAGTTQGGVLVKVTTSDPITIGTTSLAFAAVTQIPSAVSAYIATLLDDTTQALARNTLGLSNQRLWCGSATGTANALTLTPAVAAEALVAGLELVFQSGAAANSGATTIAVSALAITAAQSNGVAMVGGEIEVNKWYRATYDGAAFQVERVAPAVLLEMLTTKGDLVVATADQKAARLPVGAAGTVPMSRAAATSGLAYVAALTKSRYGNIQAHNAGDVTNDWDISAGGCMDVTGAYWITTAALTKQADVAWAVGNAAGLLDTGAVGNSEYYLFAIARSDTGVTDYLSSLSSTAPTMPANYDFKRLIGYFRRVAGVNTLLDVYETEGGGIELGWRAPTLDVNLANTLTTSRRTDAVKVPTAFSTIARLAAITSDAAATTFTLIVCPDETDTAPTSSNYTLVSIAALQGDQQLDVRTNSVGAVAARSDTATVDVYSLRTKGFYWARRN